MIRPIAAAFVLALACTNAVQADDNVPPAQPTADEVLKRWLGVAVEFVQDNVGPPMLADDYERLERQEREDALWGRSMAQDQDNADDKNTVTVDNAKPLVHPSTITAPQVSTPTTPNPAAITPPANIAVPKEPVPVPEARPPINKTDTVTVVPAPVSTPQQPVAVDTSIVTPKPQTPDPVYITLGSETQELAKAAKGKLKNNRASHIAATATVDQALRLGASQEKYPKF